jgi:enamine deaminase RidA (YjgF/YER057c/UK114 family)
MERRLVSGHSPYEGVAGFSRAVVAGDRVHVSGTAPIPADGSPPPAGAYEQAVLCLTIIAEVLARAGSGLEHVVRTNIYITDPGYWDGVARAHGEAFRDIRPAATCVVSRLLDDAWKVEIEAEATLAPDADEAVLP